MEFGDSAANKLAQISVSAVGAVEAMALCLQCPALPERLRYNKKSLQSLTLEHFLVHTQKHTHKHTHTHTHTHHHYHHHKARQTAEDMVGVMHVHVCGECLGSIVDS